LQCKQKVSVKILERFFTNKKKQVCNGGKKKIEEIKCLSQDLVTDFHVKIVSLKEEIETLFTNMFEIKKWGEAYYIRMQ